MISLILSLSFIFLFAAAPGARCALAVCGLSEIMATASYQIQMLLLATGRMERAPLAEWLSQDCCSPRTCL